jgi:hypothetical protein
MLQVSEPVVNAHVPTVAHDPEPHLLHQQPLLPGHQLDDHLRLQPRAAAPWRGQPLGDPCLASPAKPDGARRSGRRHLGVHHHHDRRGVAPHRRPPHAPLPGTDRRVPAAQVHREQEQPGRRDVLDDVAGGDGEGQRGLAVGREDVHGEGDVREGEPRGAGEGADAERNSAKRRRCGEDDDDDAQCLPSMSGRRPSADG